MQVMAPAKHDQVSVCNALISVAFACTLCCPDADVNAANGKSPEDVEEECLVLSSLPDAWLITCDA